MKTVISASRRTDIPAFYLSWLIRCLKQGYAEVTTPYGGVSRVDLRKEKVHTLVLWSKNFRTFLSKAYEFKDYRLFFNFTINNCKYLEPNIPDLTERIKQVKKIALLYGAKCINWRFDPIVFWNKGKENNLGSFKFIAREMAKLGVKRCYFSFCSYYNKVINRAKRLGLDWYDPPLEEKRRVTMWLADYAKENGIIMYTCCNEILAGIENVEKASCIDGNLLELLSGEQASKAKDASQRAECNCTKSIDIGSYILKCRHSCLYCYANPAY